MKADMIVSGKLFMDYMFIEASFAVYDGRIIAIGKSLPNFSNTKRIEMNGSFVILPGMVDMHVHMRDLELSYKEDWFSGTSSAAAGGVTFVADMPNTKPKTNNIDILKKKMTIADSKSVVDFGLYFGVPRNMEDFEKAIKLGILGLKIYPEDYNHPSLVDLIKKCTVSRKLTVVHPELLEYVSNSPPHSRARPEIAEYMAVRKFIELSLERDLRIHLTHITTYQSLLDIINAKIKGADITCDVTPHHIFLNRGLEHKIGFLSKVNPPLRKESDRIMLFNGFRSFLVDAYVTDHAPHSNREKEKVEYSEVPPGFPGLEIALPLLLDSVFKGDFPLSILNLYSRNPAHILGLKKGAFVISYDADFVVVNYKKRWIINGEEFISKAKYTPFEGFEVKGKIYKTFVRGINVFDDGEILVRSGFGKNVGLV